MNDIITVIITTYDSGDGVRYKNLFKTYNSLVENLCYDNINYIITDDSNPNTYNQMVRELDTHKTNMVLINTDRKGVGFAKNNALKIAFQSSPYVLLMEDDWELNTKLDLNIHVKTLSEYSEVGMIRFGYLGGDMTAQLSSYADHTYWKLLHKSGFYVYSGQVSLRHKRFYDIVGYHIEGVSAGKEEEEMCHRYSDMEYAPAILWSAEYGTTLNAGPFYNIGLDSSVNGVDPL